MSIENYDKTSAKSIFEYALKLFGKSLDEALNLEQNHPNLSEIANTRNRGDLGSLIERYFFKHVPPNDHNPDFSEAGVEYVGVIVGSDFKIAGGELVTNPVGRAKTDKSLNGYKSERKINPLEAEAKADEIIRNTYRTLMSRGMKGCYVYFTDPEVAKYFRDRMPG